MSESLGDVFDLGSKYHRGFGYLLGCDDGENLSDHLLDGFASDTENLLGGLAQERSTSLCMSGSVRMIDTHALIARD